jgi:hypothetical protein
MTFPPTKQVRHGLQSGLRTLATSVLAVALAVVSAPVGVCGQAATKQPVTGSGTPPVAALGGVSLASIELAQRNVDHTAVQLRRFFEPGGAVYTVREEVRVDANGGPSAPYSLTFLALEGELPGSPKWQAWSQNYARFANLFHQHGGFRVRDLARSQANYTLHDFGPVTRAGRSAQRVVVFPNRLDKAVWLLDVDAVTFLPLYTAEYDAQFRLLSEIEVVTFSPTVQLTTPNQPSMTLSTFGTFAAAQQALNVTGLVEPSPSSTGEYVLHKVQVADNPLNNRRTLVLTYTDGVDEFFVIETPGVSEFFAGLPSQQKSPGRPSNTMARYRDPSMSVLLFWDDGVGFQVAGRGSLLRLDDIGRAVFTRALLGR